MSESKKIAVIGGGAAGFFSALSVKYHHPEAEVQLFESSQKLLAKVKVSGGGRCNVTHDCTEISKLIKHYPRGGKFLKKTFIQFSVKDTISWFHQRNVDLKVEEDGRMFPESNDSQTIIDCLMRDAQEMGVQIQLQSPILELNKLENDKLRILNRNEEAFECDKVIIATGGSPKRAGFDWLSKLGHKIESPVPSLFTFNMPSDSIKDLMGLSSANSLVRVESSKLRSEGPILITHWGMSGPAILKLSAWGAREFNTSDYNFAIRVSWLGLEKEDDIRELIENEMIESPKKQLSNLVFHQLPNRLWLHLLVKMNVSPQKLLGDLSKKEINKMTDILFNDRYEVSGKTTFKEEFVTCGGISLDQVDPHTLESKVVPGLFFAGEILDIDGVTGGFNFQAAWTTGFVAGKLMTN